MRTPAGRAGDRPAYGVRGLILAVLLLVVIPVAAGAQEAGPAEAPDTGTEESAPPAADPPAQEGEADAGTGTADPPVQEGEADAGVRPADPAAELPIAPWIVTSLGAGVSPGPPLAGAFPVRLFLGFTWRELVGYEGGLDLFLSTATRMTPSDSRYLFKIFGQYRWFRGGLGYDGTSSADGTGAAVSTGAPTVFVEADSRRISGEQGFHVFADIILPLYGSPEILRAVNGDLLLGYQFDSGWGLEAFGYLSYDFSSDAPAAPENLGGYYGLGVYYRYRTIWKWGLEVRNRYDTAGLEGLYAGLFARLDLRTLSYPE